MAPLKKHQINATCIRAKAQGHYDSKKWEIIGICPDVRPNLKTLIAINETGNLTSAISIQQTLQN